MCSAKKISLADVLHEKFLKLGGDIDVQDTKTKVTSCFDSSKCSLSDTSSDSTNTSPISPHAQLANQTRKLSVFSIDSLLSNESSAKFTDESNRYFRQDLLRYEQRSKPPLPIHQVRCDVSAPLCSYQGETEWNMMHRSSNCLAHSTGLFSSLAATSTSSSHSFLDIARKQHPAAFFLEHSASLLNNKASLLPPAALTAMQMGFASAMEPLRPPFIPVTWWKSEAMLRSITELAGNGYVSSLKGC